MIKVEFSFSKKLPEFPFRSSSDLGNMTVTGSFGAVSTFSRTPDQSMMVVLSASLLLYGMQNFLSDKNIREYQFNGIGCSFWILFRKSKDGIIIVTCKESKLEKDSPLNIKKGIESSVYPFLQESINEIESSDRGLQDFIDSYANFVNCKI